MTLLLVAHGLLLLPLAQFGGGGHKAASGCTMPMPLADAKQKLVSILEVVARESQQASR